MNIPRKRLRMSRARTIAISGLIALLSAVAPVIVGPQSVRADVASPSWWNGNCDVNNNPNSYPLGASFNGVEACGPRPIFTTQSDHLVNFGAGASEFEWECVELVMRYMYQVYGIAPYVVSNNAAYNVVNDYSGSVLTKVSNNGVSLPTPGDILAFAASANHPTYGHTAVVTAVGVDSNGNGSVTYLQQNASANGSGSVAVTNNTLGDSITGWLHNPNYVPPAPSGGTGQAIAYSPTSNLPIVAAHGPNNSLWVYWQTADAQWHGPLGVGASYSRPSIAFSPISGLPTIAVQGPSNSLWVYWETSDAQWHGPLGVGSSYAAPSIAEGSNGLPTIAVQGPSNTVYVYWQLSNGSWAGPIGVSGGGTTYSAPSIAVNPTSGLPTIAVQGPSNTLYVYWQLSNGSWAGPVGVGGGGSTNSAPSIAEGSNGLPYIAVQGPSNSLWVYWQLSNGSWAGPLGVGASFASPSVAINAISGLPTIATQGSTNTLYVYWETSDAQWHGPVGVGGGNSTYAAPSIAEGSSGLPTIATQGPSNSLWAYWQLSNASWAGPLGIGGGGSTY
jgi:hypothetical protein